MEKKTSSFFSKVHDRLHPVPPIQTTTVCIALEMQIGSQGGGSGSNSGRKLTEAAWTVTQAAARIAA